MKIKMSALVSEIRGKLNGSVASRNRGGAYLRNKVTPANPQTSYQSAVRNTLTALSQAWRGLTQAQRDAWDAAVTNFQTTDVFGDLKSPSGQQLYVRINANLDTVGVSPISTPPIPTAVDNLDTLSLAVVGATSFDVTFTPSPVPASHELVIEATPGVSAGKKNLNNLYRIVTTVAAAQTSPQDINTEYETKFGATVTGLKYGIRCYQIEIATGLKSGSLKASAVAS